ncbi:hypothetical protein SISNIDRAFT_481498 [Sistotremastrum niveocremeum HHB9708]|uniref:MARVEL domain-containing protein n=2 Tax=Sistotremastraceae TaxID=3402574 RepID=A0A164Z5Z5_9AGAM|nr:hypothetical protein SISNIDRAFT_481498 [Sistotremastrum niveocremeum HHB9708]KZT39607.1 hypothetical protein SISSUDRAFT_1060962 [Sistotremastrum suecicum HHB10207 ss-3]
MAYPPFSQQEEFNLVVHVRSLVFCFIGACAISVLGLAANFMTLLPTDTYQAFLVFALIVSAATVVSLIVILLRSQPRIDMLILFLLIVGWIAMGAWTGDIIDNIQCFTLAGQTIQTKTGHMSSQVWCREMKAILALSWTIFGILLIIFIILLILIIRVVGYGHHGIWGASISDIPWFGQGGYGMQQGYYGQGGYPMQQYQGVPYMGAYQQPGVYQSGPNQYTVNQAPGHAVVIGGNRGGVPNISQQPA